MNKERSIDKLARYIIYALAIALISVLLWYFRSVLVYMLLAAVFSLVGRPIMSRISSLKIKGKCLPPAVAAIFTIIILLLGMLLVITQVIPMVSSIIQTISANFANPDSPVRIGSFTDIMDSVNAWIIANFPQVGAEFKVQEAVGQYILNAFDFGSVSGVMGHVATFLASFIASFGIGLFSVVFISFFFIRKPDLFASIVAAFVPDNIDRNVREAISDIEYFLSRYFVGLLIEVTGVALINFVGLWLIGGIGAKAAAGIAFLTGILNVIPYVGPLVGAVLGTVLAVILKLSAGAIAMNFWVFVLIVVAIFVVTQLVDNFIFQPLIYSASIKATALEIFIVLLIAGHVGGMVGMLVAIPSYTAVRVVAGRFFYKYKPIRKLVGEDIVRQDHIS